jgi:hypothetical protein
VKLTPIALFVGGFTVCSADTVLDGSIICTGNTVAVDTIGGTSTTEFSLCCNPFLGPPSGVLGPVASIGKTVAVDTIMVSDIDAMVGKFLRPMYLFSDLKEGYTYFFLSSSNATSGSRLILEYVLLRRSIRLYLGMRLNPHLQEDQAQEVV